MKVCFHLSRNSSKGAMLSRLLGVALIILKYAVNHTIWISRLDWEISTYIWWAPPCRQGKAVASLGISRVRWLEKHSNMQPNHPSWAWRMFMSLSSSKNFRMVGGSNLETLTAAIPLYGAIFHTSGLLNSLFWPAQASHGRSGHDRLVFSLLTTGPKASNLETHFCASDSGPWYTKFTRMRFC